MITYSERLQRQVTIAIQRYVGSLAVLVFYKGAMPEDCEAPAQGERLSMVELPDDFIAWARDGHEPDLPEGATYWRLVDGNNAVLMQGTGHE